ncbi:MAG: hypothetical protein QF435_10355, partial [Arenicellales bacterium]|nr:hypothetical protein [Arenicellales bacterium]
VASPLVGLPNYRPGQALPGCDVVLDLTGDLRMEHVDTCVVWKIDPCPVQSLVARSFVLERILTNQTNSALKLLSLSMGPSRLIDQRSIRLDLNSPTRSVAGLGQSAVGLVVDTLLRWHRTGVEPGSSSVVVSDAPRLAGPTTFGVVLCLARRFLASRRQRDDRLQWSVATIDTTLAADSAHWYEPPLHIDVVDPFPVRIDGRLHVFVELLDLDCGRGQIAVFTDVDQQGFVAPQVVLERPFHLSFPVVFEHKGVWFMLPEQSESGRVSLYRNTRFPDEWVFERDLLPDFRGLDTIPLWHDDRWWLFTTARSGTNIDNNLHIFHANSFDAEFQPLAMNPVKSSLSSSRMAGHFFMKNGQLMRPAQNGCRTYGGGIVLNRVDQLTTNDYKETQMKTLDPYLPPYLEGLHTLNYAGDIAVVDGVRRLPGQGSRWR